MGLTHVLFCQELFSLLNLQKSKTISQCTPLFRERLSEKSVRDNFERCVGSLKGNLKKWHETPFFKISLKIALYRLIKAHLSYNIISLYQMLSVKRACIYVNVYP